MEKDQADIYFILAHGGPKKHKIRISILGTVLWIKDPDPALIGSGFSDANKNEFFVLFLTKGT